jgi:DMSO/TMAO reductase YedYZ molybdopterin-dependent catalytic subunit
MTSDVQRVPPGQYLTERFPVLTVGPNPPFELATWSFTVDGAVERPLTLGWDELMAMEQHDVTVDIHCVTRWSKLDTTWRGVRVTEVLERAGLRPDTTHAMAHSDGGYTTNVSLEMLRDEHVLLAHSYGGAPLEPDHGAPLRLLVPSRYFWKSAKFIRRLELLTHGRRGFWEENGYTDNADPWTEERTWF